MFKNVRKNKRNIWELFGIIVSFGLITILFSYSLWSTKKYPVIISSDFFFHMNRLKSFLVSVQHQQYFPRIAVTFLNYNGYASPMFYSNLIFYPLIFWAKFSFSYLTLYKILIMITTFSGLVITYVCAWTFTKKQLLAYLIAILYMTSIFYQYELLVRNALGEGVAMIFLPIVLLGMYRLVNASNHGWLCLCLGMTLLVYTHLITTVMCGIMLLFYLIFNVKKVLQNKLILVNLIKASVVSFLLSATFLLPMLEQLKRVPMFINASEIGNINHFIKSPFDLFSGTFANSLESTNLGIIFTLVVGIRIIMCHKQKWLIYGDRFIILGIIIAISSTNVLPWEQLLDYTKLAFLQYPLRLNVFATLLLAIGSGMYIYGELQCYKSKGRRLELYKILAIVLILFMDFSVIFSITSPTRKSYEKFVNSQTAIDSMQIGNGKEYLPVGTKQQFLSNDVKALRGRTTRVSRKLNEFKIRYQLSKTSNEGKLVVPLLMYPGYAATENKHELKIRQTKNHQICVYPKRSGIIHIWYRGTDVQKYASLVSISTLIILVIFQFFSFIRRQAHLKTT